MYTYVYTLYNYMNRFLGILTTDLQGDVNSYVSYSYQGGPAVILLGAVKEVRSYIYQTM